jgi:NAD(P)-dependent dehydrogenase (short-subunit alcohol dehydrogenase family)
MTTKKTVLVTGSTSGSREGIARHFAEPWPQYRPQRLW